ncbi:hypothetical protein ACJX0J_013793, partial [Zea mays]
SQNLLLIHQVVGQRKQMCHPLKLIHYLIVVHAKMPNYNVSINQRSKSSIYHQNNQTTFFYKENTHIRSSLNKLAQLAFNELLLSYLYLLNLRFHTKMNFLCILQVSRFNLSTAPVVNGKEEGRSSKHERGISVTHSGGVGSPSDEKVVVADIVESSDRKGLGVGTSNPLVTVPIHLNTPVVYRSDRVHPLNKRFHFSKTDKLGRFPRTNLFSPVGLFDLHISDDESDHKKNTAPDNAISIVDQMYNDRNIFNDREARGNLLGNQLEVANVVRSDVQYIGENRLQAQHPNVPLPCSVVQLRYYYILCGMGRSQWKDFVAVRFSKTTTVNWESFGLSIEPNGHCDNFFIAGFCRKHFEDVHPRLSKKHFFYPKVGHSMMEYNSQFEFEDLRKSFLGANSALKLHRSNKLYFPVCHSKHWFLFIVDLKNKRYVFLDSYFDEDDPFQCFVRDKLIRVFKVLWLLYSKSNMDLSSFKILYPAVPKQENTHDCCIFTLKYMEYWDISVDMMLKFRAENIPQIRISLANELYFSEKNTEDKSLVRNMFLQ